uniref:Uncharacterized protein n=1 Tax=Arundo donax TaxID=35708 RepID=A0A0A9GU57_ARUDO
MQLGRRWSSTASRAVKKKYSILLLLKGEKEEEKRLRTCRLPF